MAVKSGSIALPVLVGSDGSRALTAPELQRLAEVSPESFWFANLDSAQTRRAYESDLRAFMTFAGISASGEFRLVTRARAHVLAWRTELERQALSGASIRRKLAALSSLFEYLCEVNSVATDPVKGVKRLRARPRASGVIRRGHCLVRRMRERSRASGIGRSCQCFCFMACAARSSASLPWVTSWSVAVSII